MNSYKCVEVIANSCTQWVAYQDFLYLSDGQGMEIGGKLLFITIVAWCFRELSRFILNRK